MNVLHVVVAGDIGGAERMLVDLASTPNTPNTPRHFVFLRASSEALVTFFERSAMEVVDAARLNESPARYVRNALGRSMVRDIRAAARKVGANVLQAHTIGSHVPAARAAIAERLPLVRTEHSTRAYDDPSVIPFSRWSLGHASAIACVSEHIANVVRRWLPLQPALRDRIWVIPNGVDTDRFALAPETPTSGSDASSGPSRGDMFTFALVGRLEPRKGVDIAIEALARVPRARLVVVGDGPSRGALEHLARARGVRDRVNFEGRMEDPRAAISRADAMLSASRKEALGLALLEGMSMGRPAVASPTGGIPEFVTNATGYLARDGSSTSLAAAMREAMSDPQRAERGAAAADLVRKRYTLASMRDGYAALYDGLSKK